MPELPEVETIVRALKPRLIGQTLKHIEILGRPTFRQKVPNFLHRIRDVQIEDVFRYGKAIFIAFKPSSGTTVKRLKVHLGMTGQFWWIRKTAPMQNHTHLIFHFKSSTHELRYVDIRRFGQFKLEQGSAIFHDMVDAWAAPRKTIVDALRFKNAGLKHALLSQKYVVGLGNIYVDESLFLSNLSPHKKLSELSNVQLEHLVDCMKKVLAKSIRVGGTSFQNYVDIHGERGGFKDKLFVYGKAGKPCVNCKTPIRKITLAGRGTHFCPQCQA